MFVFNDIFACVNHHSMPSVKRGNLIGWFGIGNTRREVAMLLELGLFYLIYKFNTEEHVKVHFTNFIYFIYYIFCRQSTQNII